MTNLFVFTAGSGGPQRHLDLSIRNPVQKDLVFDKLGAEHGTELQQIFDQVGGFYAWGNRPTKRLIKRWEAMQPGDEVLTVYGGNYHYRAQIISKFHNEAFARELWGTNAKDGNTWEYFYFLTKPEAIAPVPTEKLGQYLNKRYFGLTQIRDDHIAQIESAYGSLQSYLDQHLPSILSPPQTAQKAYLLTWNPERWSKGGAGTAEGRLGIKPGDQETWTCHTKQVQVGDPVYLIRLGKKWPRAIIAKGRACTEPTMGPHWDAAKAPKQYRSILVDFEEVRNESNSASISIEELQRRFPGQDWSPQSSGIEIKEQYRGKTFTHSGKTGAEANFFTNLFKAYLVSDRAKDWIPRYTEIIQMVAEAKQSKNNPSDDLVERIWYARSNGIARTGRGQLSRKVFEEIQPELVGFTKQLMLLPSREFYASVIKSFESLKVDGRIDWIPRLVIRRAIAAVSPETICAFVNKSDFLRLGKLLEKRFGEVFKQKDTWFGQNRKYRTFLKEHGISDSDLPTFNTFCWYVYEQLLKESNEEDCLFAPKSAPGFALKIAPP